MSDWVSKKIGDIANLYQGLAINAKTKHLLVTESSLPLLRIKDLLEGTQEQFVDPKLAPLQCVVEPNELVMTRTGQVGYVFMGKSGVLHNNCFKITVTDPEVDTRFLYWHFNSNAQRDYLTTIAAGSVQPDLNHKVFKDYDVLLPPLLEQKAIASVLSSLDDKIDLLHRQNKTLEAMAEALFRQWFIEDEILAKVAVSELIEFNPKRSLSKGIDATYLEMAGLSTQSFNATGYYRREFSSGTKFIQQDTLLARITPCLENGKAGYVTFLSDNEVGWGSTEYIVMRPKVGFHPLMAYIVCRNKEFKDYAESCMEGSSGRQRVNLNHLQEFIIGKPSDETIQQFNDYLESVESKLIYNSKQIKILEQLKETILPKLMNGEIRLKWG